MTTDLEFQKLMPGDTIPPAISELYIAAFPEEERRPLESIRQRIEAGDPVFNFFILRHGGKEVGFATVWRLPGATYIEHFAIFPNLRGHGYGADVITELLDKTRLENLGLNPSAPLVLEVELPESSDMAVRRINFYRRCGLEPMEDFPYFQPPYVQGQSEVPMMLMTSAPLPDPEGFVIILHTIVYNQ